MIIYACLSGFAGVFTGIVYIKCTDDSFIHREDVQSKHLSKYDVLYQADDAVFLGYWNQRSNDLVSRRVSEIWRKFLV
jgi:hypothetical protein